MAAASLTSTTFTLKDDSNNAVAATVAYDGPSRKATLTPSAPLGLGRTYTATVDGGAAASPTSPATRWPRPRPGASARRASCPCTVFAPSEGPVGDALSRLAGRGRHEVHARPRTAGSRRCGSTSSPTTPAPTPGICGSASGQKLGRGDVHERDRLGLAGGAAARARPDHQGHDLRHVVLRGERPLRLQPRLLRQRHEPRPAARAQRLRGRRQRRLPLRRRAASRTRPSAPPTTGSTRPSSAPARPTRARRASPPSSPAAERQARAARAAKVEVTFDEAMDRLTVNTGSILLRTTARATPSPAPSPTTRRPARPR